MRAQANLPPSIQMPQPGSFPTQSSVPTQVQIMQPSYQITSQPLINTQTSAAPPQKHFPLEKRSLPTVYGKSKFI